MSSGTASLVGSVIAGRYRVIEPLARGGAGAVYRALQLPIEREVAIKVLRADLDPASASVLRQRFLREAELASRLRHPNIVSYLDAGIDGDTPFVVMELLKGRTLKRALKSGPLSSTETARVGARLADALHHAHSRGLIHRDIKPGNVFLLPDDQGEEQPVLVDFGLVRATDGGDATRTTLTMGTPPYMSPEQIDEGSLGPSTDIYGLGVLLYRMVAGVLPFDGGSPTRTAIAHLQEPVPPVDERAPGVKVDESLEALIVEMLAKSGEERPSAAQVANRLGLIGGVEHPELRGVASPPSEPDVQRSGWRWPWLAGALVLISGAAGSWFLWSTGDAPPPPDTSVWLDLRDPGVEGGARSTTGPVGGEVAYEEEPPAPQGEEQAAQDDGSGPTDPPEPQAEPAKDASRSPASIRESTTPARKTTVTPRRPPSPPPPVQVGEFELEGAHAQRMLAFLHDADREALALSGVYSKGVNTILSRRPFADLQAFFDTPGIGVATFRAVMEASRGDSKGPVQPKLPLERADDGRTLYDGVAFTEEHASRALRWVNEVPIEEMIAAGIYDQGAQVLVHQRPFASLAQVASTPAVGTKTMERIHDATEPSEVP